jgi:glycosyltransferase involved in cell wall biosynthesis
MAGSAAPGSTIRVAVTLEQCWHRVPGGTAVAAIELAGALSGRDDVEVVGVSARHRRPPPDPWVPPIAVRALPIPRRALYETWHYLRWPAVQRATGPVDVIHATGVVVPPHSAPLVVTAHDFAYLHDPSQFTRNGLRFFRRALALARRHADILVCPSEATRRECVALGFRPERLRVVPHGVRSEPASAADIDRVRASYGLDRPYVAFVGTVEPRKNLGRLIEAFAAVDAPGVDLAVVGPKGWKQDLAPAAAKLGSRARVLGFVPREDLGPILAGAALFAYPSLREGFGLPVLEAMAQGTAVVTSAGTATEEVVDGSGILVDPLDARAIAEAIAALLRDPARASELGAAGRERAAGFSWQRSAELCVEAYRDACR